MDDEVDKYVEDEDEQVDEEVDEDVDKEVDEEVDTCCSCDPSARSLTCWPRMPGIPSHPLFEQHVKLLMIHWRYHQTKKHFYVFFYVIFLINC